jgi:hypothetical protein
VYFCPLRVSWEIQSNAASKLEERTVKFDD